MKKEIARLYKLALSIHDSENPTREDLMERTNTPPTTFLRHIEALRRDFGMVISVSQIDNSKPRIYEIRDWGTLNERGIKKIQAEIDVALND